MTATTTSTDRAAAARKLATARATYSKQCPTLQRTIAEAALQGRAIQERFESDRRVADLALMVARTEMMKLEKAVAAAEQELRDTADSRIAATAHALRNWWLEARFRLPSAEALRARDLVRTATAALEALQLRGDPFDVKRELAAIVEAVGVPTDELAKVAAYQ